MEGSGRARGGPRSRGGGDGGKGRGRGRGRGRSQYYRGDGGGRGVQHLQGGGGDGDFGGGTGKGSRGGQQQQFYPQSPSGGYGGYGGSGDYSPDLYQTSTQPYTQQSPGGGGRGCGYGGGGGRGSSSSYHQQARHPRGNKSGPESDGVSSVGRDLGPGKISVGGRGYHTGGGESSSARSSCGSWGQAPQPAVPGCTRLRFGGCGGVKPRWYTSVEVSDMTAGYMFSCCVYIIYCIFGGCTRVTKAV